MTGRFSRIHLTADSDGLTVNVPSLIRGREQIKRRFKKVKILYYLGSLEIVRLGNLSLNRDRKLNVS